MKPILRNAGWIASLWPLLLLTSLAVDAFVFALGHRSAVARVAGRADLSSLVVNDRTGSLPIGSFAGRQASTEMEPLGVVARPVASWRSSCVAL